MKKGQLESLMNLILYVVVIGALIFFVGKWVWRLLT